MLLRTILSEYNIKQTKLPQSFDKNRLYVLPVTPNILYNYKHGYVFIDTFISNQSDKHNIEWEM